MISSSTELQIALRALGYYSTRHHIDGIAGPATMAGLLAWRYDLVHAYHVPEDELGDDENQEATYHYLDLAYRFQGILKRKAPHIPATEECRLLDEPPGLVLDLYGKIPPLILMAILGCESGSSHCREGHVVYGIDFQSPKRAFPAGAVPPYIYGRGWGLGQFTPSPADRRLPPGDGVGWPDYIVDERANLLACADLFWRWYLARGSLRRGCTREYDCRDCLATNTIDIEQQKPCSFVTWCVMRYAGVGKKARGRVGMIALMVSRGA
jgi:hypothetical protein